MVNASALDLLSRSELIERAREIGVERPERMTRAELRDEILRLSTPREKADEARGLFGVARSMLASVVEAGLNMPDAAAVIRGESELRVKTQPPVATVTLAEIYAAQGHRQRALRMLEDVLAAEPDHEHAKALRQRLVDELAGRFEEPNPSSSLVETTGEEIRTGKPPEVIEVAPPSPEPVVEAAPRAEPVVETAPVVEAAPSPEPEPLPVVEAAPPSPEPEPEPLPVVEAAPSPEPEPLPAVEVAPPNAEPVARQTTPAPPPDDSEPSFPLDAPREDALFMEVDARGTGLYWELSPASLDRVRRRMPEGETVLRVVSMRPSWDGAERFERTVPVREEVGVIRLSEVQAPSVVRAAVGWQAPEGFTPLALGADLAGDYRPPVVPVDFEAVELRARSRLEGI